MVPPGEGLFQNFLESEFLGTGLSTRPAARGGGMASVQRTVRLLRSLSAVQRAPLAPAPCALHAVRRSAPRSAAADVRAMSDGIGVSSVSSVGFRLSRSGRFSGETDPLMEQFNASLPYDKRMWKQDIQGSIAYAAALGRAGLLKPEEVKQLQDGLALVAKEWEAGTFEEKPGDEDIHTANERRLTELVGAVGGKLHTGRSRNDQVRTPMQPKTASACQSCDLSVASLFRI